jgi:Na+-translocating ferredoxin:NAD+ oxidoreductase RNF subunit RnfB
VLDFSQNYAAAANDVQAFIVHASTFNTVYQDAAERAGLYITHGAVGCLNMITQKSRK